MYILTLEDNLREYTNIGEIPEVLCWTSQINEEFKNPSLKIVRIRKIQLQTQYPSAVYRIYKEVK
jgi:hypothetical protein